MALAAKDSEDVRENHRYNTEPKQKSSNLESSERDQIAAEVKRALKVPKSRRIREAQSDNGHRKNSQGTAIH